VSLTDSKNPPCNLFTRETLPRPPHPIPTFVTMANAPLVGRDGGINKSVSTKWRSRIFLQRGLDTGVNKLPDGQITRLSRSIRCAEIASFLLVLQDGRLGNRAFSGLSIATNNVRCPGRS
jgi:hypothetical protein